MMNMLTFKKNKKKGKKPQRNTTQTNRGKRGVWPCPNVKQISGANVKDIGFLFDENIKYKN